MDNAPTRPRGAPRSKRRSPRGPRSVARSPRIQHHYDNLIAAATFLREQDRPELAGSIDYVLGPDGRSFLTELNATSSMKIGLSISTTATRKRLMMEGKTRVQLEELVNEGFKAFLAGEFDLRKEKEVRSPSAGSGDKRAVLTIFPDVELQAKVAERCRDLTESGEATVSRLGKATVAAAILFQHFGIGAYSPDAVLPRELTQFYVRSEYMDTVVASGLSKEALAAIADEGLRRFLDGSFELHVDRRPRSKPADGKPPILKLPLNPELMAAVRSRVEEVRDELGLPGYMGASSVAAASLYEHFGLGPYASDTDA